MIDTTAETVEKAQSLLADFTLFYDFPVLDTLAPSEKPDHMVWTGNIADYVVEIEIMQDTNKWGGKSYILSHDGVVLDNLDTLARFDTPAEAFASIILKSDSAIARLERSGITGEFPFIGHRR